VEDVFEKDPAYYSWMINNDFPLYTKKSLPILNLEALLEKAEGK